LHQIQETPKLGKRKRTKQEGEDVKRRPTRREKVHRQTTLRQVFNETNIKYTTVHSTKHQQQAVLHYKKL
jgi:hypothetical protein